MMYDQRLKAQRDYQWGLDSAWEEGRQEGWEGGELSGRIQTLQEIRRAEFHRKSARTNHPRTVRNARGFAAASAVAPIS